MLSDDRSSEVQLTQLTLKPGDDKIVFFSIDGKELGMMKIQKLFFA